MNASYSSPKMSTPLENAGIRRKSSAIASLMTLNCNLSNIPIINEPGGTTITTISGEEVKKKSLRFEANTFYSEYDAEEVKENKRKITDEIKKWVQNHEI